VNAADELHGLLTAYRLATAPQPEPWSPIEAERQEQRATDTAREIANLLLARTPTLSAAVS
jgi:hypothetical protein